ncbi:trafficking protein particle complex subunit 6 [Schistosoma bovis]|uniref:Trafficking protein particle complex subunit 6 n=1 Tax=Schistosoma bovis TaxID=6184 RepID=A0A430Q8Q7_SCHBO|nr:trafficking protein particle complex subunit 6 [Schistosoma bovis]
MKNANVPSFDAFDALMIEIIKYSNSVSSDVLFFLIISIPLIFENSRIRIFVFLNPLVATKDHARFINELDIVKYVCTEFWSSVYHKQVDTLKTNYQDVYVLIVNDFQPLVKFESIPEGISEIPKYLAFPSGLLKGALCSLGLNCVVAADCEQPPTCKFAYNKVTLSNSLAENNSPIYTVIYVP